MRFAMFLTMKSVVIGGLCAGALAAGACGDRGAPTSPSAAAAVSPLSASSPRSGDLHATKECSSYTGAAGSFCTITASNLEQIEIGSKVVYASAAGATLLESDVVLDLPGPGNNAAFGHCRLDFATGLGLCTFSGGTGKFTWFEASARVSCPKGETSCTLDGTYRFSPHD